MNQETITRVISTVKENSNSIQIMSNHIQKNAHDDASFEEEEEEELNR
jgi:hypothetical protein